MAADQAAHVAAAGAALGIFVESVALFLCPVVAGVMTGTAVRYAMRRRLSGAVVAVACLMVPTIAVTAAVLLYPVIGLWDGAVRARAAGHARRHRWRCHGGSAAGSDGDEGNRLLDRVRRRVHRRDRCGPRARSGVSGAGGVAPRYGSPRAAHRRFDGLRGQ